MLKVKSVTNARGDSFAFSNSIRFIEGPDFSGLSLVEEREFYFKILLRRLVGMDDATMQAQKARLYTVFNPSFSPFRLELLADDGKEYYIDADLVTAPVMPPDWSNSNAAGVKALLQFSADVGSLLYEKSAIRTEIALWEDLLEFDVSEIVDNEFEFERRVPSLFKNVQNTGHEKAGIKVIFRASQEVVRPSILNVETYEKIELNTTMLPGDAIELVNTQKRITITLIRNNVRSNAFSRLTLDSDMILLNPGDNIFRYDAESGRDFLEVAIIHHNHWIGV